MAGSRPSGTVTFLFTDIEGSTRLWEEQPDDMQTALQTHDEILLSCAEQADGHVFATGGDGFGIAFSHPDDGVAMAVASQRRLLEREWPPAAKLRVRMGLHTGTSTEREQNYYGPAVNRAARIMSGARSGQVLVSEITARLMQSREVALHDMGLVSLAGISEREHIFEATTHAATPSTGPSAAVGRGSDLPQPRTSLVGRTELLERLEIDLGEHRLVTLSGVGGVGKTRTAIELCHRTVDVFRGNVWFVELASLEDPAELPGFVQLALGLGDSPGDPVAVISNLVGRQRALLVVDNCEHVLDEAADLVDELLSSCPDLVVVATSREGLGIDGEAQRALPSLGLDGESPSAVALFEARARDMHAGFTVDSGNAVVVAELCRRLDGIPLAIELAAARIKTMDPEEILERLNERFALLASRRRRGIKRHQTMRAALDWSYQLLSPDEQTALAWLSVVSGGADLPAATAILAASEVDTEGLDLVESLVDKSLVVPRHTSAGTRYGLLEAIRDYGQERLAESGQTVGAFTAHAHHYCERLAELRTLWPGPGEAQVTDWILADMENLRAAVAWLDESGERGVALQAFDEIVEYLASLPTGVHELARQLFPTVPDRLEPNEVSVATTMAWRSYWHNDPQDVRAWCRLLETIFDEDVEPRIAAAAQFSLVTEGILTGDLEHSLAHIETATELAGQAGAQYLQAQSLFTGVTLRNIGELGGEQEAAFRALDLAEPLRAPTLISGAKMGVGRALLKTDPERAREVLIEAVSNSATGALADSAIGNAILLLAVLASDAGDQREALNWFERCLRAMERASLEFEIACVTPVCGLALARLGEHELSQRCIEAGTQLPNYVPLPQNDRWVQQAGALNAPHLDEDIKQQIRRETQALTTMDVARLAIREIQTARTRL